MEMTTDPVSTSLNTSTSPSPSPSPPKSPGRPESVAVELEGTFDIEKKRHDVCLTSRSLTWWESSLQSGQHHHHHRHHHQCIQLSHVIGVRLKTPDAPSPRSPTVTLSHMGQLFQVFGPTQQPPVSRFTVYVGKSNRHMKWKVQAFTFSSTNQETCSRWVQRIKTLIHKASDRPKRLHVIVNPFGGKGQGLSVYKSKVAPLFDLADIHTSVTITENPDHARSLMLTMDLQGLDGIVSVGGDGTFAEVVNGLLIRAQREEGVSLDDPSSTPVPLGMRVGIIPAGSTDVMAYDTTGVNEPVTSAIQIILGFSLGLDVCSVHHNNSLLRYIVSFLGYGFLGDVLKESENYRWMGPARYEFAGVKEYFRHQAYRGEVAFQPSNDQDNTPWDKTGCKIGCGVCSSRKSHKHREKFKSSETELHDTELGSTDKWHFVRGQFTAINAALVSGRSARTVTGMSPMAHLGNGCIDLVLVRQCSRFDYLRHLLKLASSASHFNFDFVEVHRVKAFKFRSLPSEVELGLPAEPSLNHDPSEDRCIGESNDSSGLKGLTRFRVGGGVRRVPSVCSTSSWNMDGEVGEPPDIDVRVHCQLIKVFARGPELPEGEEEVSPHCCLCQGQKTVADPYEAYSPVSNEVVAADE